MRFAKSALSLLASKSLPGTSPILENLASSVASAGAGGLVFMSCASSVKYSFGSMRFTCSRTAVFMSIDGFTVPARTRVGLSVRAQRHHFELILGRMDGGIILRGARA